MTQQEVAQFADKTSMINERTQLTYKTGEVDLGYFYNNKYSTTRQDNIWNFIVMKNTGEKRKQNNHWRRH